MLQSQQRIGYGFTRSNQTERCRTSRDMDGYTCEMWTRTLGVMASSVIVMAESMLQVSLDFRLWTLSVGLKPSSPCRKQKDRFQTSFSVGRNLMCYISPAMIKCTDVQ